MYPEQPLFELKGLAKRIDLSAWISGLSFAAGLWIAGLDQVALKLLSDPSVSIILVGAFAIFMGIILLIQSYMSFSMRATTYGEPVRLVTSGIFRYSRNPIYVAFLLPLASISAFSYGGALAAAVLYIGAMNATIIRTEELHLLAKFGKDYERYLKKTPRWVLI